MIENAELSYLLGMITGKGSLRRGNNNTDIFIQIPHKNLEIEDMNTSLSVRASIQDIREIIEPLTDSRMSVITSDRSTTLKLSKPNENFFIREINKHFPNSRSAKEFRIPEEIFQARTDIKREFLIGLSDVTAHIRSSNAAYGHNFENRVYIEIPVNWYLTIDISNLLLDLNVPVQTIDWGHPNTRDPYLKDYNKGKTRVWFREHQIKIYAEQFENVGFRIHHKIEALHQLAEKNRVAWNNYCHKKAELAKTAEKRQEWLDKIDKLENKHNKFYWERRDILREKPFHPMENDERIPEVIKGEHFNSWREIASALGYSRK